MTATTLLPRFDWLSRLRTIMVLRPGQRVVNVPGIGVSVSRRAVSSGAADWWTADGAPGCVAAYDSVAASKAASQVNRVTPGTLDMVEAGTVTWLSGAWSGFSDANYFNTGVIPANGYSMIAQFADGSGATWREVCGSSSSGSTHFRIAPVSPLNSTQRYYGYANINQSVATAVTAGIMALTATGGYYNGSSDGAVTTSWSGTGVAIFVGMYNNNGSPNMAWWNGSIQRLAIYSGNIAAYVAAITAAMAAL